MVTVRIRLKDGREVSRRYRSKPDAERAAARFLTFATTASVKVEG